MPASSDRKLHNSQQLYHLSMVAIPFFYSDKPTNTLAIRGVASSILNILQVQVMQKLYYKNNKPVITNIISMQSVEKAQQCDGRIRKEMQTRGGKYMCEFCKDISSFAGILFQPGKTFVTFPETKQMKDVIDAIAQSVVMNGAEIEQKLKQTEQPLLAFLNERTLSLEHIYYRWRVYSYLQGDGDKKYRNEPFQITRNGPIWYPPQSPNPYPSVLNIKQIKYLDARLQKMERRKFAIEEIMIFAIHNINYAVHITSIILVHLYEALKSDFIGFFYLISDILFNSTNHAYKDLFQFHLPLIIYRYVLLKQNDESATLSDKFLTELKKLLLIWEKKFVFDENFMKGLMFLLELCNADKLYKLKNYPQHQKIRQIFGGDQYLYDLQKSCVQNGIPFFQNKEQEAKLFINALFWQKDKLSDVEPDLGKYDGEPITDKQILKIQSKGMRVVSCQNLPVSMLFEKSLKSLTSKSSLSQDGA